MQSQFKSVLATITSITFLCVAIMSPTSMAQQPGGNDKQEKPESNGRSKVKVEKAILAGGCFWGMEDLFRKQPGVISTRVGYTGGEVKNATYRNHGSHAEAIEVVYDPSKTNFRKLLEFFFQIHDPTTKNQQGNDRGASYRSAIFYTSDEQKQVAIDTIADVNDSGLWPGKVVTEVEPASDFWEAEAEHQDYLVRNPNGYTCHFPRKDWDLSKRKK
jgi:peptide-methionine (S)-S-oxide reductase